MEKANYIELLHYIAKHLVTEPDAIQIEQLENGDSVTLQLRVAPADIGRVIGRQGRIAKEIRAIVKSCGMRDNKRVTVDILD